MSRKTLWMMQRTGAAFQAQVSLNQQAIDPMNHTPVQSYDNLSESCSLSTRSDGRHLPFMFPSLQVTSNFLKPLLTVRSTRHAECSDILRYTRYDFSRICWIAGSLADAGTHYHDPINDGRGRGNREANGEARKLFARGGIIGAEEAYG